MNRYILLLIFLVIVLTGCKLQTFEERLHEEARQYTLKNCPKRIDNDTTLDSCVFSIPMRTYYYNYTVSGELDADSLYTRQLHDTFHQDLLASIKNSIQLKGCKDAGIIFCYRYYSKRSGKLVMTQKFTRKDYQ